MSSFCPWGVTSSDLTHYILKCQVSLEGPCLAALRDCESVIYFMVSFCYVTFLESPPVWPIGHIKLQPSQASVATRTTLLWPTVSPVHVDCTGIGQAPWRGFEPAPCNVVGCPTVGSNLGYASEPSKKGALAQWATLLVEEISADVFTVSAE